MLAAALPAADDPFADLNLEAHGFVSFGYLKSWGNNWHGETLDGTDEFWEAAANVIARPMDRLRLGAQLFARDLGIYGNGQVEVDWAYADWRAADALGVQVGRVKMPFGLSSESLDASMGRASVFLPSLYPTRAREILLSTDGGKLYGTIGDVDWALYGGRRYLQEDGDFASYFAYRLNLSSVNAIDSDGLVGGMLHWYTPLNGLAFRVSGAYLKNLTLEGTLATAPVSVDLEIPFWYAGIFSLLYERGDFTIAAEYERYYACNNLTFTPSGGGPSQMRQDYVRTDAAYVAGTWHLKPWLELYASVEGVWSEPTDRHGAPYSQSLIGAVNLLPLHNWSLKAEFRYTHGTLGPDPQLNPSGVVDDWQVLALKTTVDF